MLAECPRCGVTFNTEQEGMVTCGICGNWFYAYEDDEDDEDEFCPTPFGADAEQQQALGEQETPRRSN